MPKAKLLELSAALNWEKDHKHEFIFRRKDYDMVDPIFFNNAQAAAGMQSANIRHEQAKTSAFEEALNAAQKSGDDEKVMEAAREFESYFLQMMFKEMRNTVPKGELIPRNNAEEIFQSMLDEEYAKNASQGAGIGLAQMIYEQMTRGGNVPPVNGGGE